MLLNKSAQVRTIVFAPCPLSKVKQECPKNLARSNSTKFFIPKASLMLHDFYLNFVHGCLLWINWNCLHQPQKALAECNLFGIIRTRKHGNLDCDCKFTPNTFIQVLSPHNGTLVESLCSLSFQPKSIEQSLSDGDAVLLESVKLVSGNCRTCTAHGFVHKRSKVKAIYKCPDHCDLYGILAYSFIQRTYASYSLATRCTIFGEVLFLFKEPLGLFIGLRCAKDAIVTVNVQASLICLLKNIKLATRIVMHDLVRKSSVGDAIADYTFDFDSKYTIREMREASHGNCHIGGNQGKRTTLWILPDFAARTESLLDKWAKIVEESKRFYEREACL